MGRRPGWVYDGDEPDPRYTLANERTFLAWVRTVLAVLAGAVALHSLGVPDPAWLRGIVVSAMLVFAAAAMALAWVRWARVERAMRLHQPLPGFGLGLLMTVVVVVVALLLVVALTV